VKVTAVNNTRESTKNPDGLSYIIPVTGLPAFRGNVETGINLTCANGCDQILIEEYDPEDFIRVGIQCVTCGCITRTPAMSDGEIFCARPIPMAGDAGNPYCLNATIPHVSGVIWTTVDEIGRVLESTSPKDIPLPLEPTESCLISLVEKYKQIVGDDLYRLQRKKVEQNPAKEKREFPFAWSIVHLEKRILRGDVNPRDPDTLTAITWLRMFCHVVGSWSHHPRFNAVARIIGDPKAFIHTCSQLIAAAYMYKCGNHIGLTSDIKQGQPNPDLYIRGPGRSKVFMEVKAPQALQPYGYENISRELIKKAVKDHIADSSQIKRSHRGLLIISSTATHPNLPAYLEQTIERCVDAKGRIHQGLAAVVGMVSVVDGPTWTSNLNLITNAFRFSIKLNKSYDRPNPVVTTVKPPGAY
jgi:hypothetical protein